MSTQTSSHSNEKLKKIVIHTVLIILSIITLFPVLYTILASFQTNQAIMTGEFSFAKDMFTLDNYKQAWNLANFGKYTLNSVYMTTVVVIGTVFTCAMAGYVFATVNMRYINVLFTLFISTMFITVGSITLLPTMNIMKLLNLTNGLNAIILVKILSLNASAIFLIRNFVKSLPKDIDEAAIIDGCSYFRRFYNIALPLIKPILATVALITFRDTWNDYLMPMVFTIGEPESTPLIVGVVSLKTTGEAAASWNLMLAGTVLSVIPMLVAYFALNSYFIEGLTSGSVKG